MYTEHPWRLSTKELEQLYTTDVGTGLTGESCAEREKVWGKNRLAEKKKQPEILQFLQQFCEPTTLILLGAGVVSILLQEYTNAIAIAVLLLVNSIIGYVQEHRAETSLQAISQMTAPHAAVLRHGLRKEISAVDLVPGDVVILEAGDFVPADLRLVEVSALRVDESALTGESLPVEKRCDPLTEKDLPLAERANMAFMSTLVAHGRAKGIVTAIGAQTEMGKVAGMLEEIAPEKTPLQQKLSDISKTLSIASTAICLCIFGLGLFQGQPLYDIAMSAFSLAIAAIPEGMPLIVTIILACGIREMAKNNAIMKNLTAIETAGAANIVLSDKTGTLTQNKMTVTALYADGQVLTADSLLQHNDSVAALLRLGILNNDGVVQTDSLTVTGEATEAAILQAAVNAGISCPDVRDQAPRVYEIPFDSDRKRMTTVHKTQEGSLAIVKGAPEAVLALCAEIQMGGETEMLSAAQREGILYQNNCFSAQALRVIAVAYKVLEAFDQDPPEYESDLIFCGLFAMIDPPKEQVRDTVARFYAAGIDTAMITGDNSITATAIARQLGIAGKTITGSELDILSEAELGKIIQDCRVFARVTPQHKLKIVEAFQKSGNVAIMTGDGVNDAPALKKADIGVSMGIGGTEVAKSAADMILADDNFSTISHAILYGRQAYANIKRAIHLMLCGNIGEIAAIFLATALGKTLFGVPILLLTAVQILWFNVVSDALLCIALGMEPVNGQVMEQTPRKKGDAFFGGGLGCSIGLQGAMLGVLTFTAFVLGAWMGPDSPERFHTANTMAFMVLSFGQFFHSFTLRSDTQSAFQNMLSNKPLVFVFLLNSFVQISLVLVPFLRETFGLIRLSGVQWGAIFALAAVPVFAMELKKLCQR